MTATNKTTARIAQIVIAFAGIAIATFAAVAITDNIALNRSNRMDAVGGAEVYAAQREAHLRRLAEHTKTLRPEFRDRETNEFADHVQDLDIVMPVKEIGNELKVEAFLE
jgi:NAD/NADP transhydrogenase alpha subunit